MRGRGAEARARLWCGQRSRCTTGDALAAPTLTSQRRPSVRTLLSPDMAGLRHYDYAFKFYGAIKSHVLTVRMVSEVRRRRGSGHRSAAGDLAGARPSGLRGRTAEDTVSFPHGTT